MLTCVNWIIAAALLFASNKMSDKSVHSAASLSSLPRTCSCGRKMSSLANDPHDLCGVCRVVECDIVNRCKFCREWTNERMSVFLGHIAGLRRKRESKQRRRVATGSASVVTTTTITTTCNTSAHLTSSIVVSTVSQPIFSTADYSIASTSQATFSVSSPSIPPPPGFSAQPPSVSQAAFPPSALSYSWGSVPALSSPFEFSSLPVSIPWTWPVPSVPATPVTSCDFSGFAGDGASFTSGPSSSSWSGQQGLSSGGDLSSILLSLHLVTIIPKNP